MVDMAKGFRKSISLSENLSSISTSSSVSPKTETERIVEVYARRAKSVPAERYSAIELSNLLRIQELERQIIKLLKRSQHIHLDRETVLDVGCGEGFWLRQLIQWGALPENLFGIDLLQERIQKGKEFCPKAITLQCGDASKLEFGNDAFSLILQLTVFTSILDPKMKKNVASEMSRVLKPGGAILWYDYFVSNPSNPDVRGVTRKEISALFPELSLSFKRITLAPPLGRMIAPISSGLYHLLSAVKPLCTHYLGFFQKQ
jgi:ubiquinone/menaquinone biosynthesis C-methylase UbiE